MNKSCTCGCCEGIEILTPLPTANRPGLSALSYRVGTHATFLETMMARLSSLCLKVPQAAPNDQGRLEMSKIYPLQGLKTRDPEDPAIALLDGWATVGDVLTFYQERMANEGYLRTATERRSVLELARLIGYRLRPGVAASVYLAYTLDEDKSTTPPKSMAVTIPKGSRVQSVPGPGELPQSFETSDDLEASSEWNNLQVRRTRPQLIKQENLEKQSLAVIYLSGIATNLKVNDPLLFVFGDAAGKQFAANVQSVEAQPESDRTKVELVDKRQIAGTNITVLNDLLESLRVTSRQQRGSATGLPRRASALFEKSTDMSPKLIGAFSPALRETLYRGWGAAMATPPSSLKFLGAFRVTAKLFGHNATKQLEPLKDLEGANTKGAYTITAEPSINTVWDKDLFSAKSDSLDVVALDSEYPQIKVGSWVLIKRPVLPLSGRGARAPEPVTQMLLSVHRVKSVATLSMQAFGLNNSVTILTLETPWVQPKREGSTFDIAINWQPLLRRTTVYAQFEELPLAEEPIEGCVGHDEQDSEKSRRLELQNLVQGLDSGRWLIVAGERNDIKDQNGDSIAGVMASELALLANVEQKADPLLPGEKVHTTLVLETPLAYCYKRESFKIYANVVKATHGETRNEVLGSGDTSKSLQQFTIKQPPLTFVSATNPAGVDSTLVVRVNDVQWHEVESLAGLSSTERVFITRTDDEGKTSIVFGNGAQGMRLPTGQENITTQYRSGIGKPGNVGAERISLLVSRPLNVKEVINPLSATGGADKESRDQARVNAPLAVTALDRLVSTQDYGDFARMFAGIGKATATRLTDGHHQLVHVTVAGMDDIPIATSSDLYRNLTKALRDFGDPYLPIQMAVRELILLVTQASVRVLPDFLWEKVEPKVRAALLEAFGFGRRELGRDALLSELISVIQGVPGVAFVDVDIFGGIPEINPKTGELVTPDQIAEIVKTWVDDSHSPYARVVASMEHVENGMIRPSQLAILTPDVPDTLILNEVKS